MSDLPLLTKVQVKVTFACNLSCPGCYVAQGALRRETVLPREMERWGKALREDPGASPEYLVLHGGEPTLLGGRGLEEILSAFCQGLGKRPILAATSNLQYEDEDTTRFFVENQVRVSSSIDLYRPLGEVFYRNARELARAGCLTGFLTVVSSTLDPEAYVELAQRVMDRIGTVIPIKFERFVQPTLGPFRKERNDLVFAVLKRVERLMAQKGLKASNLRRPPAYVRAALCSWWCFVDSVSLLPEGTAALCSKAPFSTVVGSLDDVERGQPLSVLIHNSPPFRARMERETLMGEDCRDCPYLPVCGRGCIWQPLDPCPMGREVLRGQGT